MGRQRVLGGGRKMIVSFRVSSGFLAPKHSPQVYLGEEESNLRARIALEAGRDSRETASELRDRGGVSTGCAWSAADTVVLGERGVSYGLNRSA